MVTTGIDETQLSVDELAQALRERGQLDIAIPADPTAISTVTDGVAQALRNEPGVIGREFEIELALREALSNAVRHGCQFDRTKFIQCRVTYESEGDVLIVVRDPGPGFDVTGVPNPLDGPNVFKGSGRGLFLIRQLMDEVRFTDGGREVHMRKVRSVAQRRP